MQITLFNIEEANRTATEIRPELEELVEMTRQHARLRSRLGVLELALAGATDQNPDAAERHELQARRRTLAERIRRGIQRIHRRGCLIKDLERGLIDFYALSGDRLVFLCWQLGEKQVAHWHPLDSGFAGRQPVAEDESSS